VEVRVLAFDHISNADRLPLGVAYIDTKSHLRMVIADSELRDYSRLALFADERHFGKVKYFLTCS